MEPRDHIANIARIMHSKGLCAANDGNISIRLNKSILITPSASHKGFIKPGHIIECDLNGQIISGSGKPSTEINMHLLSYGLRPEAKAVIHAHPPTVLAFTVAGLTLDAPILPEAVLTGPPIPTAPYAPPTTDQGLDDLAKLLPDHPAIVLDRHGSLTVGKDLIEALARLEQMENLAKVIFTARLLGQVKELTNEQLDELKSIGQSLGLL